MYKKLTAFIQGLYQSEGVIPLHAPQFSGNEKKYLIETIDSTFVSSVGQYVDQFEQQVADYTGCQQAVATINGTAALHAALFMAGVRANDMVITQALTFVATCNVIHFMQAEPVFVDVNQQSLSLCPVALESYLQQHAYLCAEGTARDKVSKQIIRAVVPMHTFGHPAQLDELAGICKKWHITLVEDAAESLGSFYKGKHTGTIGEYGAISFNGNKIITTGGGGMVLCSDQVKAQQTKHLTTTAKVAHAYEFYHDQAAFNYRMPNLNAALGCGQMEMLTTFLAQKRKLAALYQQFFQGSDYQFVVEPEYAQSNYWLNAVICPNKKLRDELLEKTNQRGVMTRPVWQLMHHLPMYKNAKRGKLPMAEYLESRVINLPSSPIVGGVLS
jgi:aminotransferase in exopolysaccharide biosynthesis